MTGYAAGPAPGSGLPTRPPRLVATDLDGTLLHSDGTVSERSRAALAAADAAGIGTVFVTARPPRWMDPLASLVSGHGTVLCGNGAFVYDVPSRTVVSDIGFAHAELVGLVTGLRDRFPRAGFAVERRDGIRVVRGYVSPHGEDLPDEIHVDSIEDLDDVPVGKLLVTCPSMGDEEFLARVREVVGARGIVAFSGAGGLAEVSAPGVTKAATLARWCDRLGVAPADVWAFGDMPNDLPMLRWAGVSFAVANAHPDVLAAATHICPANDDDGVAQVIEGALARRPGSRPTAEGTPTPRADGRPPAAGRPTKGPLPNH